MKLCLRNRSVRIILHLELYFHPYKFAIIQPTDPSNASRPYKQICKPGTIPDHTGTVPGLQICLYGELLIETWQMWFFRFYFLKCNWKTNLPINFILWKFWLFFEFIFNLYKKSDHSSNSISLSTNYYIVKFRRSRAKRD